MSRFLPRRDAAEYLRSTYGFGTSSMLARAAVNGDGPPYAKTRHRALYRPADLDKWALSRIEFPPGMEPVKNEGNDGP
jgi:hypothetical protein